MKQDPGRQQPEQHEEDIRDIPTWARRYAENRTVALVAYWVFFLVFGTAIGGLSYLTAWAYVSGHRALAVVSMLLLVAVLVVLAWFSFVGGASILRRIADRFYRGEGHVSTGPSPDEVGRQIWTQRPWVGFLFLFCVIAHIGLGLLGILPISSMQPVSALYFVPFCIYLGMRLRGIGSPLMFLWPALYTIHAILFVVWPPIRFGENLQGLNMLIPVAGYGTVAALASYIYGRIALRRLRALAATSEATKEGEGAAQ